MAEDQLHEPLRPRRRLAALAGRRVGFAHVAITLLLALLAAALIWAWRASPPPAAPVVVSRELPPRPAMPSTPRSAEIADERDRTAEREGASRRKDVASSASARVKVIDVERLPDRVDGGARTVPESGVLHLGGTRLVRAPQPDLVQKSPYGPLPKVGRAGREPWRVYARPVPRKVLASTLPRIAVVVALPAGAKALARATLEELPPQVSLALAAHDGAVARLTRRARGRGHEVLLQVPMEPWGYPAVNPGPDTLLASDDARANRARLLKHLARAQGYVGIMPLAGQKLLQKGEALSPVLHELKRRGLLALEPGVVANSLLRPLAMVIGLPVLRADVLITADMEPAQVRAALRAPHARARRTGGALVLVHPSRNVLTELVPWLTAVSLDDGLHLVPATALAAAGGK